MKTTDKKIDQQLLKGILLGFNFATEVYKGQYNESLENLMEETKMPLPLLLQSVAWRRQKC